MADQSGIKNYQAWAEKLRPLHTPFQLKAAAFLGALCLAEFLTFTQPTAGLIAHGVLFVGLLILAIRCNRGLERRFYQAVSAAPLIRFFSLSLPLADIPFFYWYVIIGIPLFLTVLVILRVSGLRAAMIGINGRTFPLQILVGLAGLALGWVEYLLLKPAAIVTSGNLQEIAIYAVILFVFTGVLEEIIFRGLIQYSAISSLGKVGLFFVPALYTVMHLGYRSWVDVLFVLGVACFFTYIVQRTGSIVGVSISHGLLNIGLFLIFPLIFFQPEVKNTPPVELLSPVILAPTASLTPTQTATGTAPAPSLTPTAQAQKATQAPAKVGENAATAAPSETSVPISCPSAAPAQWVVYTVRPGDTLSGLSRLSGASVRQIQEVNCMNSTLIRVGQMLFLPKVILPSATVRATATKTAAAGNATQPPTTTPAASATLAPTFTSVPTNTPAPSDTDTPVPTNTEPAATAYP
jgi:uncharacterized protein